MMNYIRKNGSVESRDVPAGRETTMQILVGSDEAPNFAMRKFSMAPHGGMPLHTNLVEHEQFILKGSATVRIGDQTFEVCAGDAVFIPGEVPHSYTAGKDGFEFLCVVPNQKDQIQILDPPPRSP